MSNIISISSLVGQSTAQKPIICLGMPLYNQTKYLSEALNSLLAQTYSNFRLIISDDSTESGPGQIVTSFVVKDQRIDYFKNECRLGMVGNWRRCLQLAGKADYFAWVGDHDVWHPNWLESLVEILNVRKNVLLVYPQTSIIDENGHVLKKEMSSEFSSVGVSEEARVQALCLHGKGFGNMVYGLFRTESLLRAGMFRKVIMPDVMLLLELSLQGDIYQVEQILWFRRNISSFSIARQKKSLFVKKPWYLFLPWPIVNSCALFWNTTVRSDIGTWQRRKLGLKLSIMYLQRWLGKLGQDSWIGSYQQWRSKKWRSKKLSWTKKIK